MTKYGCQWHDTNADLGVAHADSNSAMQAEYCMTLGPYLYIQALKKSLAFMVQIAIV